MTNKRLEYLLNSYLAKTISSAEEQQLFALLASDEYDEEVKEYMSQVWPKINGGYQLSEEQSQKILSLIFAGEQAAVVPMGSRPRRNRMIWAAASILLLVSAAGFYFITGRNTSSKDNIATIQSAGKFSDDVLPGTNGAILKLADGSTIVLDSASNGTLSKQGNTLIIKDGSRINYVNGADKINSGFNTIETPKGRQFALVLEDGTKVWLNAASSIHFPVIFDGAERRVEVTGEVYFEVAKNAGKPFRVSANGTTVEVLGTHFNVNAYQDEASINTTLLEGSVKIIRGENSAMLSPGQQAQVNDHGAITKLRAVNLNEVMAWKDNNFSFDNTDIKKLMRQLARWYDVDVEYKDSNANPVRFNGAISRNVTLSNVLKMLELTGEVSFSIQGKKIIVMTQN